MARKRRSSVGITAWLTKHYQDYLARQETEGGHPTEWQTEAVRDALAKPAESGCDKAFRELLGDKCQLIWHQDPAPEQFELFHVAGIELEKTYTFDDPTVPYHYRRVTARWATTRQVEMDAMIAQSKAAESVAAALRKIENAGRIMAEAGFDPDMLLWDLRERKEVKPAEIPEPADVEPVEGDC
jgi:hypothetical protein